jgi:phosphatidylserine decarboxylase
MEILKVLPKNAISRLTGGLVALEHPRWVAQNARDWFIKRYNINMSEAELPLESYPSIAKLFTRKLKPGIRPIGEGLVHPCDGQLTCAEQIDSNRLIQAKGQHYKLNELLVDEQALNTYGGGAHLVYYLCPTDYHRVHAPVDGEITDVVHVPGALWPVNEWSVQNISDLFSVNERVIFNIKTALGPVALVMVGATNVGKITVSFDPCVVGNQGDFKTPHRKHYDNPVRVKKGDELGIFNMGSTVVMIYPKNMLNVLPKLGATKLGQSL